MEQTTQMNSRVEKIKDFIKTNVQPMTDKKGEQVFFLTNYPRRPQLTQGIRGASLSQTHNINHVHVDEKAVETTLEISSLRSGKDQADPYKDH